jgi:hypothetical protein
MSDPSLRQMLQLQLATHSGADGTVIRTAPQWQDPLTVTILFLGDETRRRNPRFIAEIAASAAQKTGFYSVRLQALLPRRGQ